MSTDSWSSWSWEWSRSQPYSSARAIVLLSASLPANTDQSRAVRNLICLFFFLFTVFVLLVQVMCATFRVLVSVCDVNIWHATHSFGVKGLSNVSLVHPVWTQSPVLVPLQEDHVTVHLEDAWDTRYHSGDKVCSNGILRESWSWELKRKVQLKH